MARKSRKDYVTTGNVATKKSEYRTAVYVRLSKEDDRKIESDTVENQIEFLQDFVAKDSSLVFSGLYVDRNFTGTKFDRPQFNRMIEDVKAGSINCVVVKDLSRLGRNYLEAGDYIEKIFPFFGTRFIAVNDNYDSLTSSASEDGLAVPLKNLINEAYAKDVSRKVCTTFENMFKQGIFLANTAAYGYRKDPDDPHNVLVDEEVRDVVVRIFKDYTDGKSHAQIARELNADGILAPSVYWQKKDVIHTDKFNNMWEGKQIRRILENPIYTGDVQIAKTQKCYYKGITTKVNRKDGYYVKNHHEAIIDYDTFDRAQKRMQNCRNEFNATRGKYDGIQNKKEDMLQGVLFCGHCGNQMNMYRKTVRLKDGVGHYSTYVCRRSATYGEADPAKNIKAEKLENMVLELIKVHIEVYVDAKDRLQTLNRTGKSVREKARLEKKYAMQEERKARVGDFIRSLYEDFADDILTEEEYLEMKGRYLTELENLDTDLEKLRMQIDTFDDEYGGDTQMKDAFAKYLGADALSRDMVKTFIKRIICYGKDSFEVEYNFADELEELNVLADKRGGLEA